MIGRTNLAWSGVEYDYERSQCTCHDWICRCTTIESAWVEDIDINTVMSCLLIDHFPREDLTEIDLYCFDRICRMNNIWDKEYYEIKTCPGYYGEEIDGVFFLMEEKVIADFNKLITLKNDIDKIKYVLELEYGYVIESIDDCRNVAVIDCDPKLIVAPQQEYYHRLKNDVVESYKDYKIPCSVCKKNGDKYLIIDGYHRVAANKDKESIEIIVID